MYADINRRNEQNSPKIRGDMKTQREQETGGNRRGRKERRVAVKASQQRIWVIIIAEEVVKGHNFVMKERFEAIQRARMAEWAKLKRLFSTTTNTPNELETVKHHFLCVS
jgi:hypothetical protein